MTYSSHPEGTPRPEHVSRAMVCTEQANRGVMSTAHDQNLSTIHDAIFRTTRLVHITRHPLSNNTLVVLSRRTSKAITEDDIVFVLLYRTRSADSRLGKADCIAFNHLERRCTHSHSTHSHSTHSHSTNTDRKRNQSQACVGATCMCHQLAFGEHEDASDEVTTPVDSSAAYQVY